MSTKRWVVVGSLGLGVVVACATADEQNPDDGGADSPRAGGGTSSSAGKAGSAGTTASAGTAASEGGKSSSGGVGGGGAAGKTGTTLGGSTQAGSGGSGGKGGGGAGGTTSSGGKGGTSSGGTSSGGTTNGGTSSAGTSSGGSSGSTLGCNAEAAGGAEAQAGAAGAPSTLSLFFDDFEAGSASKWTTTLGTWAVVDDDSKAYEQSLQENKLQMAIANGLCAADQIIDARIKVVGFKGQSNSYVAALFGRVVSPSTHYLLALGSDNKLVLRKRVNTTSTGATGIGSAKALTVSVGQWYDVHFELIGTSLKGCVGDVCVTGTDSSIAGGSVGVGTVNTSARFDDVRLTMP